MSEKFDPEARANALFGLYPAKTDNRAIILAREAYAAGRREGCEEVAAECAVRSAPHGSAQWRQGYGAGLDYAGSFARRHAAPPSPETREQRLEKALRRIVADAEAFAAQQSALHPVQFLSNSPRNIAKRALEEIE